MRRSIISISSSRQRMRAWRSKAEQQRVPLARLGDVEQLAHFQRRGFGGELAQLGMGDAFQQRIRVDQAGQPVEPVDPEPDRLRGRGPGRLFEAIRCSCRASTRRIARGSGGS